MAVCGVCPVGTKPYGVLREWVVRMVFMLHRRAE